MPNPLVPPAPVSEPCAHVWKNYSTDVPGRAGPLLSTVCEKCGERGWFPDNLRPQVTVATYPQFTPADVAALRAAVKAIESEWELPSGRMSVEAAECCASLRSLADRLAALLPPDEKPAEPAPEDCADKRPDPDVIRRAMDPVTDR